MLQDALSDYELASNVDQTAFPNFGSSLLSFLTNNTHLEPIHYINHMSKYITYSYSKGRKSSRHCEQAFLICSYEARCSQCHMECRKERGKPVLLWTHIGHAQEVELVSTMRSSPNLCRRGRRRPGQETESFIWSTASLRSAGTGNVKFSGEEYKEWVSGIDHLSHIILF